MSVTQIEQLRKYGLKYDADNVTAALTAIRDTIMIPRFQVAVQLITQDREKVRQVLTEYGVDPGLHGIHYAFGFAVSSAKFSHSGPVLQKVVAALKARFVALGAIPGVCDAIAAAITGYTPYY
jgi:hypothetical protein